VKPDCSTEKAAATETEKKLTVALAKVQALESEVTQLKNGPAELLKEGLALLDKSDDDGASKPLGRVVAEYPASAESSIAKQRLDEIAARRAAEEAAKLAAAKEAERLRREGFKALKPSKVAIFEDQVGVKPQSISVSYRWIFDRTGWQYSTREPRKGYGYLVFDFQAGSLSSNPALPVFVAFVPEDDHLRAIGAFRTEFYKWSDYGAYLGNYADFNNDFGHRDMIKFTAGLEVDEETLEKPIFVAAWKPPCLHRRERKFEHPAVYYERSGCDFSPTVKLDEVDDKMIITHIYNRKRL